ncbi:MAG: HD domain-containing protein [Planctomycetota bacterium]
MTSSRRGGAIVRDPVHGDIELTREELRIIDTVAFQRLRGVKQLGTANLVYPGATHTRFDHALGTVHVMDRLLDAIGRHAELESSSCRSVSVEERRVLRFAALLHDVTHVPYGHNLEDQTGLFERHDEPARFRAALLQGEIGDVLRELGVAHEVLAILAGDGEAVPFQRQLLSDTIDADLLDYLRRDAYFTGLALSYDDRVRNYFRIDRESGRLFVDCEKQGMLREDIATELLRVLEIRYHFSERVYYHHAKIAAGALLSRLVESAMRAGKLRAEDLQRATDESLLLSLEQIDFGDQQQNERMARFVRRFRSRQLLKRALVLPAYLNEAVQDQILAKWFRRGEPGPRIDWERTVEREVRSSLGREVDVVMYCPARRMQLKEARTLVRFPQSSGSLAPLEQFAGRIPRLRDLRDSYPRLWKLYVFVSETDLDARRKIQQICLSHLPAGTENALRL